MTPIKIFNYPWHISHQYSLFQIPNTEWSWLIQYQRPYSVGPRGDILKKFNVEEVASYEKGKYDVALFHLDQQCLEDSIWERGKGSLFREVNEIVKDIPKVVIMHGTPYYPEQFPSNILDSNYLELGYTKDQVNMSSFLIERFKNITNDFDKIIFNSHKAQKQWGMENDPRAKTIWHGLDPADWMDLPKEPRVVTMISPGGLDEYYDRLFLASVKEMLSERDIQHCHITVDVSFKTFDEYREFMGRSLIYFNPTKESPMPRSRTEAMLSGACVISTYNQDAETFLEDGVNSYKALRNPKYICDLVEGLINNYEKTIAIGQAGKKTAIELFGKDRYEKEWQEVLEEVTSKKKV